MRILVVSNPYPPVVHGGYEIECRDVVAHLRRRHAVHVLTSRLGRGGDTQDDTILRVLPDVRALRQDSLRAPEFALRAARITRRVVRDVRPDVVYVWNGARLPYAALQTLHRSGVPVVYRVCEHWFGGLYADDVFMRHLTPGETGIRGLWARAMRVVNRLPDLQLDPAEAVRTTVCWNSEYLRAAVTVPRAFTLAHEDVVIPSNATTERMATVRRRPVPDDPVIAVVARLNRHKGPDVAVRALAALRDAHALLPRLVLAGGEAEGDRERLLALAQRLGVADRVTMPGELDTEAVAELAGAASVWLVPSVWEEPAGMTCIEGALARVPVVASRIGGIPEILHDRQHALLFEPGDHVACASALASVLLREDGLPQRVERAFHRGQELAFGPYVDRMDASLDEAVRALGGPVSDAPDAAPQRRTAA